MDTRKKATVEDLLGKGKDVTVKIVGFQHKGVHASVVRLRDGKKIWHNGYIVLPRDMARSIATVTVDDGYERRDWKLFGKQGGVTFDVDERQWNILGFDTNRDWQRDKGLADFSAAYDAVIEQIDMLYADGHLVDEADVNGWDSKGWAGLFRGKYAYAGSV